MTRLIKFARKFVRREEGATMIEYGLLAALVSIAAIGALQILGPALSAMFTTVASAVGGA